MIVGYLYNNLPLPIELIKIILEYYGDYNINCHIKNITKSMLNLNSCGIGITQFDLIRLFQIKLPPNIHTDNVKNYFNYNNNIFCFETPWINIFSNYPFNSFYMDLVFNFSIGFNNLGNHDDFDKDFNLRLYKKLNCDENNLLLNFLKKFENHIFIQIFKYSNPDYHIEKLNPCVLPKK